MKQFAIDATKRIIKNNLDDQNIIKLTDEYLARLEYSHLKQHYDHARQFLSQTLISIVIILHNIHYTTFWNRLPRPQAGLQRRVLLNK